MFCSGFVTVLQIGSGVVFTHPFGYVWTDWHDAETFGDRLVQRVLGEFASEPCTPVVRVDEYAWEDALFRAVCGFDIVVEVAADDVAGVVHDTEGFVVAKPPWFRSRHGVLS